MVVIGAPSALLLWMQIKGCASDPVFPSIPAEDSCRPLPVFQFTLNVNQEDAETCLHPLVARSRCCVSLVTMDPKAPCDLA